MMSKPPSSEIDSKTSLNRDRAIRPSAHRSDTHLGSSLNLDINPDIKRDANLDKIPINDTLHLPAYAQKPIAVPALTERNLTQQIHALSDQLADIKYLHHQEIGALKAQIASIKAQIASINALHQEEHLNRQKHYEAELRLAYQQRHQPAITAIPKAIPKAIPEPRMQPTTYQVPRDRTASNKPSQFFSATPFFLSMMGLGTVLIFSVFLAYPSEALLNNFVSLMSGVVPVLFLLGISSLVITAILELNR